MMPVATKTMRIGLGVLAVAAGLGGGWLLLSSRPPAPEPPVPPEAVAPQGEVAPPSDQPPPPEGAEAAPDPLPSGAQALFAHIQTELNRAAAGREAKAADPADRLERVAEALRRILAGDAAGANRALDAVEAAVAARIPSEAKMAADPALAERQEWLVSYFELLPTPSRKSGDAAVTAAFVRLALVLRKVDAVLLAEMLPGLTGYDLVSRRSLSGPSGFDGRGLRLPCRLAATQRARLEITAKSLRQLAGPLTDCPVPAARASDFAALERFARDPVKGIADAAQAKPPRPGKPSGPLGIAAAGGTLAEIEAALRAGGDPLRADGRGLTALHYLASNRALSPADRSRAVALLF